MNRVPPPVTGMTRTAGRVVGVRGSGRWSSNQPPPALKKRREKEAGGGITIHCEIAPLEEGRRKRTSKGGDEA